MDFNFMMNKTNCYVNKTTVQIIINYYFKVTEWK